MSRHFQANPEVMPTRGGMQLRTMKVDGLLYELKAITMKHKGSLLSFEGNN